VFVIFFAFKKSVLSSSHDKAQFTRHCDLLMSFKWAFIITTNNYEPFPPVAANETTPLRDSIATPVNNICDWTNLDTDMCSRWP